MDQFILFIRGLSNQSLLYLSVCSGALLWGISNVCQSKILRNLPPEEQDKMVDFVVVTMSFGTAIFCLLFQIYWFGFHIPQIGNKFWIAAGITGVLNVGVQYWATKSKALEDVSIVAPLSATMPAWLIIFSGILLNEWPTVYGRYGIALVAIGAYTLNLRGTSVEIPLWMKKLLSDSVYKTSIFFFAPWIRLWSSKGARLALLTAYLGAIAINFDAISARASNPMVAETSAFTITGLCIYLYSKKIGRWDRIDKKHCKKIFGLGLMMGMSNILMSAGFYFGIVPYVGTLKRTQILWTVVFAGLFLKEKHKLLKLIGALIIFIGALLLAF